MKRFKTISLSILLLFIGGLLIANDISPSVKEYRKVLNEEYTVSSGALLKLSNKYGNIDITTSASDKISITAEIIVETRSQSRADEIMDRIHVSMSGSSSRVTASTEYEKSKRWSLWGNSDNYKVHYTISAPTDIDLDVSNKYGNISSSDIDGDVDLYLKYGNGNMQNINGDIEGYLGYSGSFSIGSIAGDVDLEISYSDIDMEDIEGNSDLRVKYSKVVIGDAQSMDISSKYSKFKINKAIRIYNEGKYDNFRIQHLDIMDIDTKYTTVRINELTQMGKFDTGYGSVKIEDLSTEFESIRISSGYTNYDINTTGAYRIDLESKYTSVNLPDDISFSHRDKDGNSLQLKGHYQSDNRGIFDVIMKYGSLDLR